MSSQPQLTYKKTNVRVRSRTGDYILGTVQGLEVEVPYALFVVLWLSEEVQVRLDVVPERLAEEFRRWLEGQQVNNPCYVGTLPSTTAAIERYIKFGKAPSQEDLILWILSRAELDLSDRPSLRWGTDSSYKTANSLEEAQEKGVDGRVIKNPFDKSVDVAKQSQKLYPQQLDESVAFRMDNSGIGGYGQKRPKTAGARLGFAGRSQKEKQMESFHLSQNILGKSEALNKLKSATVKGREGARNTIDRKAWTDDHFRLGAYIERGRKSVESAMEERRRTMAVAKIRQKQSLDKYRKIRDTLEGNADSAQWLKDAENEIRTLHRIEADVKDDLLRQRGRAHRAKQHIMWSMAPNGYANRRGKSVAGAYLGEGPLSAEATSAMRDPRVESTLAQYYWDQQGRRHQRTTQMQDGEEEDVLEQAMNAIRKASSSAAAYKLDLKSVFLAMDTSGDGFVDFEELTSALASIGARLDKRSANAVFAHFDPNGSGSVHYGEFMWAFFNRRSLVRRWQRNTKDLTDKQILDLFYKFDKNGDNHLNDKEFNKLLSSMNIILNDTDRSLLMNRFDNDGDGRINLSEFRQFIDNETKKLHELNAEAIKASEKIPEVRDIPRPATVLNRTAPAKLEISCKQGNHDNKSTLKSEPHSLSNTRASDVTLVNKAAFGSLGVSGTQVLDYMQTKTKTKTKINDKMNQQEMKRSEYDYNPSEIYANMVKDGLDAGEDVTWILQALKSQAKIENKLGNRYYPK
jgi:Ca2+-binding EF-hand superfamily protein